MNTNPVTLLVGTGAAVLIARTFYDSLSTTRGHASAVSKKDSKAKNPSKTPSDTTSKVNNVCENKEAVGERSVPAIEIECTQEVTATISKVDQKLNELANEGNSEPDVARPVTPIEMPTDIMVEGLPIEDLEVARHEKVGSSKESAVDHSLDGISLKKTSGAVNITEDIIQLHACSRPDDTTKQSPSSVHVSVDIVRKPESGVHVSVDVMQKADAARQAENLDHMTQSNTKQLEGSVHLWEHFEHVAGSGIEHLESAVYAEDQFKHDQGKDAQMAEISVHGPPEHGIENVEQSKRDSHDSAKLESFDAVKRPESGMQISERSAPVSPCFDDDKEQTKSTLNLSIHSAYENVLKQPENERVSESRAASEHAYENTTNRPEFNDHESGYTTAENAQSEDEDETRNPPKITSSEIDREIRRSIALESLKNAIENPDRALGEMRPETPSSHLSTEQIYAAIQTLCAIYNAELKYNKDAKNYLLQIQTINSADVAGENEGPTNDVTGAPFQDVFLNARQDNVAEEEEENIAQVIENMNEYLDDADQDEDTDTESKSAASDSNVDDSEQTVDDDADEAAHEVMSQDEVNVEKESNTTTSTITNSLVIYVKAKSENDDSKSDGFDDLDSTNDFEVVSCTPNIFQNVIVRRIL